MDRLNLPTDYQALFRTLREVLKGKKYTYATLARRLHVSEVTVKRWFAGQTCSLHTVFEICDVLGVSFFDIVALAKSEHEVDYVLTEEQEVFFAANPAIFGILKMLHRGIGQKEVAELWGLTSQEWFRVLRKLERLRLLDVLPGDQVRMKVVGNIRYQHQGPLSRAILRPQIIQFLDHVDVVLKNDDVCMHSAEVELSERHVSELVDEIHALGAKYRARAFRDKSLLPQDKLRSVRWLFAFAPYETDWLQYPLKEGDRPKEPHRRKHQIRNR